MGRTVNPTGCDGMDILFLSIPWDDCFVPFYPIRSPERNDFLECMETIRMHSSREREKKLSHFDEILF